MKMRFGWLLSLGFVMALFCGVGSCETPKAGQKAPNFTLATPDGSKASLAGLEAKGDVVLILLRGYPGYQCPFCVRQVHDFVDASPKFAEKGAEILLVYPGPAGDLDQHAKEFLAKQEKELPANVHLVVDSDYAMTNLYGLRWNSARETAYPTTFLIGHDGTVFYVETSRVHGDRTTASDMLAKLVKHQK